MTFNEHLAAADRLIAEMEAEAPPVTVAMWVRHRLDLSYARYEAELREQGRRLDEASAKNKAANRQHDIDTGHGGYFREI